MAPLKTSEIIDQAMQAAGMNGVQAWSLKQLNAVLRRFHRKYTFPWMQTPNQTLLTTVGQEYTEYSSINDFWKPLVVQIKVGTSLYPVRPFTGGLADFFADTGRLVGTGRPVQYALDRANKRFYWGGGIPVAAEAIDLFYQKDFTDLSLDTVPDLSTHTESGEAYLLYLMQREILIRKSDLQSAAAIAPLMKQYEDEVLRDRLDNEDAVPEENPNQDYV